MATSDTYTFNPPLSDFLLESFERCGKRASELTTEWLSSGRRSLNFVAASWANRGLNLWKVEEVAAFMPQGVAQYAVDASVVNVLADSVVLRQYQMGAPVNETPSFTTTLGSSIVTVKNLPATPAAGNYISVGVSISVGGLVLQGFYQVISVPGSGQATIDAGALATLTETNAGTVPQFVTAANSSIMTVNMVNHGLLVGQNFQAQVTAQVGGILLLGPYPVTAVNSANQFTITSPYPAGSTATVSENSGLAQLATQATVNGLTQNADPIDILLYPLSRGDYMAIPDKFQQGRPTSFWLNRTIVPEFNIWLVPDANGPYELRYRMSRRIQDADITMGQQVDLPFRFYEAFAADVAANLSMKWAPERTQDLQTYAIAQWTLAAEEDTERVPFFLVPDFTGYTE